MAFREAIGVAVSLRDLLAAEVERAREERRPIRELDSTRLFDRAEARRAFVEEARRLEAVLARALRALADELGLGPGTPPLAALRRAGPEAETLCARVDELRGLAAELREVDRINRELAESALACVRGYLAAMRPPPRAYDRRGLPPAAPPEAGTVSRRL